MYKLRIVVRCTYKNEKTITFDNLDYLSFTKCVNINNYINNLDILLDIGNFSNREKF